MSEATVDTTIPQFLELEDKELKGEARRLVAMEMTVALAPFLDMTARDVTDLAWSIDHFLRESESRWPGPKAVK